MNKKALVLRSILGSMGAVGCFDDKCLKQKQGFFQSHFICKHLFGSKKFSGYIIEQLESIFPVCDNSTVEGLENFYIEDLLKPSVFSIHY